MRRSRPRPLRALSVGAFLILGSTLGCGGSPPPKSAPQRAPRVVRAKPSVEKKPDGPPFLPSHVIAELDDENVSPHFARRGAEGLFFYSSRGRFWTRLVGQDGAPKTAQPVDIAPAPGGPGGVPFATLRAAGDGYLAAWVEQVERNHAVKLLALDAAGQARGAPILVTQSVDELSWIDLLPNAKGALLLWEIRRDDKVDVHTIPVTGGKPAGAGSLAAREVLNWQAVATERGAAIAAVLPGPARAAEKDESPASKTGSVALVEVDAAGKVSAPVTVSAEPTAQVDVDLVEVGGKYVLAWTDTRGIDATVMLAAVLPGGKIASAPHRATAPFGEQALVELVATPYGPGAEPAKEALLAWDELLTVPQGGRLIHLAPVRPDASVGEARGVLTFSSSGPPDLAIAGDGFAAVTLAPASLAEGAHAEGAQGEARSDAPVWPTYVRFGPDMSVLAAEPVRAAPFASNGGVPYFVRGLSCHAGACTTFAGGSGVPAPLALVSLPVRASAWRPPARKDGAEAPPRATSVTALADGDHLAKVASTSLPGGGSLVGWVTYFLEGPVEDGGKAKGAEGLTATVGVRSIAASGEPGKTAVISQRAMSIGGVALASAPPPASGKPGETVVAWVARERNEPQVFLTKVGEDGAKLAQKKLTVVPRKKPAGAKGAAAVPSECSDVAIAYAPPAAAADKPAGKPDTKDGFIVAWVDTRDGNAEIYAAKVDRTLTKIGPDKRITSAPGDAAEVQIAMRGNEAWLVWSDARTSVEEGNGDIYLVRLDARSLQKIGEETRLFASEGHSRSPSFASTQGDLSVAWIEEPTDAGKPGGGGAAEGGDAGLRIARIGDKGSVLGAPSLVRGEGGAWVTSAAVSCGAKSCRGALTSLVGETLLLGAFELGLGSSNGAGPLKLLAALPGGAGQDVSLAFGTPSATSLFFADNAVGGTGRVRWMSIAW